MRNKKTQMIVEAGIMMALAMLLSQFKIYRMPLGGSVTPGSMIPIIIFAFRWGWKSGVAIGIVYGTLQMIFGGYVIHPAQALLDYPIGFGVLGFAGFAKNSIHKLIDKKIVMSTVLVIIATISVMLLRTFSHILSGVIFFAPEGSTFTTPVAWTASIAYNGSFMFLESIITIVILAIMIKPIVKVYMLKD